MESIGIAWLDYIFGLANTIDETIISPCFNRGVLPGDQIIGELSPKLKKLRCVIIQFLG